MTYIVDMENKVTYTLRHENSEWIVRFRLDGIRKPDWDYFTDSREDAEVTAEYTVKQHAEYVKETGLTE